MHQLPDCSRCPPPANVTQPPPATCGMTLQARRTRLSRARAESKMSLSWPASSLWQSDQHYARLKAYCKTKKQVWFSSTTFVSLLFNAYTTHCGRMPINTRLEMFGTQPAKNPLNCRPCAVFLQNLYGSTMGLCQQSNEILGALLGSDRLERHQLQAKGG